MLNEIHPDISLSMKAISVLDSFTKDMQGKIANEAADLCRRHKRATLSSREVRSHGPACLQMRSMQISFVRQEGISPDCSHLLSF